MPKFRSIPKEVEAVLWHPHTFWGVKCENGLYMFAPDRGDGLAPLGCEPVCEDCGGGGITGDGEAGCPRCDDTGSVPIRE